MPAAVFRGYPPMASTGSGCYFLMKSWQCGWPKVALKDIETIKHSVELKEFHKFHVWIWRLQYLFMALVVVTAILIVAGLFGDGWMSRTQIVDDDAAVVYQRFARYGNDTVLETRLSGGNASVEVPLEYFDRFRLDSVVPEPREQRVRGNRIVFEFSTGEAMTARFHLVPRRSGASETTIVVGGASFPVAQFTWP